MTLHPQPRWVVSPFLLDWILSLILERSAAQSVCAVLCAQAKASDVKKAVESTHKSLSQKAKSNQQEVRIWLSFFSALVPRACRGTTACCVLVAAVPIEPSYTPAAK
jgi:hypothetical protein